MQIGDLTYEHGTATLLISQTTLVWIYSNPTKEFKNV